MWLPSDLSTRVFVWFNRVPVCSGNDDTLLVIRDSPGVIDRYSAIYDSILALETKPIVNEYRPEESVNVLFSHAKEDKTTERSVQLVRDVIVDLAHHETELILVSVYSLRNLESTDQITLVQAMCDAKQRGVAVAVITDKDQADGDGNFTSGDLTLTPLRSGLGMA